MWQSFFLFLGISCLSTVLHRRCWKDNGMYKMRYSHPACEFVLKLESNDAYKMEVPGEG